MSTFDDILGGTTSPSFYHPTTSTGSYFPPMFEAGGLLETSPVKMEDTLDFGEAHTSLSLGELLDLPSFQLDGATTAFSTAAAAASTSQPLLHPQPHGASGEDKVEREITPLSFLDEEEEEGFEENNPKWELELEQLISDFDGKVPIDPKLKDELLVATVKDFNKRTKTMKLDGKTVQYLKLQRKRMKNRQAAIRSRERKETRVDTLLKQVNGLQEEKQIHLQRIRQLQLRTEQLEKELARARAVTATNPPNNK